MVSRTWKRIGKGWKTKRDKSVSNIKIWVNYNNSLTWIKATTFISDPAAPRPTSGKGAAGSRLRRNRSTAISWKQNLTSKIKNNKTQDTNSHQKQRPHLISNASCSLSQLNCLAWRISRRLLWYLDILAAGVSPGNAWNRAWIRGSNSGICGQLLNSV